MKELFNIEISEQDISFMREIFPGLMDLSSSEIREKISILEDINCSKRQINNIIVSNPLFLNRTNEEIIYLITFLRKIGFSSLNILFDSNPYVLSLEVFEIENYIKEKIGDSNSIEDIVNELDSNPYLFNEI